MFSRNTFSSLLVSIMDLDREYFSSVNNMDGGLNEHPVQVI